MRKRLYKFLFFLLLMMPACVNASDFLLCGNDKKLPFVLAQVISVVFILIKILVPILLVITGMISFFKATLSGKVDDELNKAKKAFINKILAAVIIFFVVSIVNFVIALVAGNNNSFSSCLNCMIHPEKCSKGDSQLARLCPGLLSQQQDYDDNCNYIGNKGNRVNYGDTGDTGIPDYSNPTYTNPGGYINNNSSGTTNNTSSNTVKAAQVDVKKTNGVTYMNGILIVNKSYSIPESYNPGGLTSETNAAFNEMKNAATNDSISLTIVSGFRSYETQNNLYNDYVKRDGKASADTYSARPGHSEHQTGLAFDVNMAGDAFANTKEGKWVNDNCYKYGFIIRYPDGKINYTGFKYEPWHLRYVGKELAEILYNDGNWVSLEEYFDITSEYSN